MTGSKKPVSRPVPEVRTIAADAPVFVISVAAQLAQMHPQTLRQYDRVGLVSPGRTTGGGRRYSAHDIEQLKEVQRLSQDDGVNLSGIKRIIELENEVAALRLRTSELIGEVTEARARGAAAEAAVHASYRRDLVPVRRTAIIPWRPSF
ncbi:MAG: helix-turn-helix transcriptional regulator [Antricoccus sp.]